MSNKNTHTNNNQVTKSDRQGLIELSMFTGALADMVITRETIHENRWKVTRKNVKNIGFCLLVTCGLFAYETWTLTKRVSELEDKIDELDDKKEEEELGKVNEL